MKILYVEDNAVNLSLIERIAKMNQHTLISYDTAERGLEVMADDQEIDLVLLDIQLAGEMDGIDFAKALRGRGDQRPIIAITAYAMIGDKERIMQAGCNEYLPKPLPIAEFLTLLAKYDPANRPKAEPVVSADNGAASMPQPSAEATPAASPVSDGKNEAATSTTSEAESASPSQTSTSEATPPASEAATDSITASDAPVTADNAQENPVLMSQVQQEDNPS